MGGSSRSARTCISCVFCIHQPIQSHHPGAPLLPADPETRRVARAIGANRIGHNAGRCRLKLLAIWLFSTSASIRTISSAACAHPWGCEDEMRLWIDGGSLHATLRCLEQTGEARDAADQLHIATQLAFADTLVVGAYGGGYYLDQTEGAREALIGIGFEDTCVEIVHATPAELEAVYLAAADSLAERLRGLFDAADFSGANFPLAESIRKSEDRFDAEVRKKLDSAQRAALYEDIRSVENNGHLIMLAKSDALWEAVRRLVGD